MTAEDARWLALPDTLERDHHGRPSSRVDGKIFATIWDDATMNVMVGERGFTRLLICIRDGAPSAAGASAWPQSRST
jgi:hypothetical protein